uniref:Uncharacterized protein n=1 Tax=Lactuca sativa TaxID=4236 RepID=A0A9R1WI08_LACSA|nr:hypothetical protein LSAT_V11C100019360 [Lactuca sativa]
MTHFVTLTIPFHSSMIPFHPTRSELNLIWSLNTQTMEKADSIRRASRNQQNPLPVLAILAKDIGELATIKEKKCPHPLAAGVAVATLHVCYGNELKQFISRMTELTPDVVQVLRVANKLEKILYKLQLKILLIVMMVERQS